MTTEVYLLIESLVKWVSLISGATVALISIVNRVIKYFELKVIENSLGATKVKEMERFRKDTLDCFDGLNKKFDDLKDEQDKLSQNIYKTFFKQ